MDVTYRSDAPLSAQQFVDICLSSGLKRPIDDLPRIAKMLAHANLTLTAWDGETLVGFARSLSDFAFCCYLSDLAVRKEYQGRGIGKELIRRTKEIVGPESMLLLLAAPDAMSYYPHIGFAKSERAWFIARER